MRDPRRDATSPTTGEHLIAYAYPSSPHACRLKRGGSGCYSVRTENTDTPMASFEEALRLAQSRGTRPQRWSMDHPSNARFLEERDRALLGAA